MMANLVRIDIRTDDIEDEGEVIIAIEITDKGVAKVYTEENRYSYKQVADSLHRVASLMYDTLNALKEQAEDN